MMCCRCYWATTDRALGLWQTLGLGLLERRVEGVRVVQAESGAPAIEVTHALTGRERWDDVRHTHTYTLLDDGTLRIANHVRLAPDFADLPRVGLVLQLAAGVEHLAWYGRGPQENYSDRKAGSTVAIHHSTVTEQYVPYIMPQEHGHKTDVRWLSLTDTQGNGLYVRGDLPFEFNALHHTDEALTIAQHTHELAPCPETILHLDHAMRGVGTGLFVDTLHPYRLDASEYTFTFYLKAVSGEAAPP